jgi:hypothetical protein
LWNWRNASPICHVCKSLVTVTSPLRFLWGDEVVLSPAEQKMIEDLARPVGSAVDPAVAPLLDRLARDVKTFLVCDARLHSRPPGEVRVREIAQYARAMRSTLETLDVFRTVLTNVHQRTLSAINHALTGDTPVDVILDPDLAEDN